MMSGKNKGFQGRDSFSRMNFLFQASMLMAGKNDTLSAYYGNLCKSIGKKSVLRIDPDVKRSLCKRCNLALRPGITAEVSAISGKQEVFVMKCNKCGFERRFHVNPEYSFWLENPKSIAEVCVVGEESKSKKRKRASNVEEKEETSGDT